MNSTAHFHLQGDLHIFLHRRSNSHPVPYTFHDSPSVKDSLEALGIPHPEVGRILSHGREVDFTHRLCANDEIVLHPMNPAEGSYLVPAFPCPPVFVVDANLGKLARKLRLLGLDTLYDPSVHDPEIVEQSNDEQRVILTRDRGLLKRREVVWGYWVRATDPSQQIDEVIARFDLLEHLVPLTRCSLCNGRVKAVEKNDVRHRLLPKTQRYYETFWQCDDCGQVYWEGSHLQKVRSWVDKLKNGAH